MFPHLCRVRICLHRAQARRKHFWSLLSLLLCFALEGRTRFHPWQPWILQAMFRRCKGRCNSRFPPWNRVCDPSWGFRSHRRSMCASPSLGMPDTGAPSCLAVLSRVGTRPHGWRSFHGGRRFLRWWALQVLLWPSYRAPAIMRALPMLWCRSCLILRPGVMLQLV